MQDSAKPTVPSLILANIQTLPFPGADWCVCLWEMRDCCTLILTEIWLHYNIPNWSVHFDEAHMFPHQGGSRGSMEGMFRSHWQEHVRGCCYMRWLHRLGGMYIICHWLHQQVCGQCGAMLWSHALSLHHPIRGPGWTLRSTQCSNPMTLHSDQGTGWWSGKDQHQQWYQESQGFLHMDTRTSHHQEPTAPLSASYLQ